MQRIRIDVALPRGPEHYWRMMCKLTRETGGFAITDIWQLTNSRSRSTVKDYIHHCRTAGAIDEIGHTDPGAVRYRVVNLTAAAPVDRRADYTGLRGRVQQQIWTTIRGLPQFTIRELAVEASTDEVTVSEGAAKDYVAALKGAGYLTTIRESRRLVTAGIFRLTKNTGPAAPAILRARFVFDRNLQAPVGVATAEVAS